MRLIATLITAGALLASCATAPQDYAAVPTNYCIKHPNAAVCAQGSIRGD